jgi:hypothetical protein
MRSAIGGVVAVLLILAAGGAEAGLFSKKRLPRPIDSPIVRPKVKEYHKPGNRQKHPDRWMRLEAPSAPTALA